MSQNAYSAFMGSFSSVTGLVTIFMMLAGRFIFRRFGWGIASMVTPVVLGITGVGFFSLTLFAPYVAPYIAALGTTPLIAAVMVGAAQNILSKSAKYSLFDPAKEMAYIPLESEQRNKGKAAVDVIGNPLGKSGGSFIQQILIFATGSLAASTPYLAAILFVIIAVWISATRSLDKQFSSFMMAETAKSAEAKAE
jgi:ATP:ADP antiporter, AAA family